MARNLTKIEVQVKANEFEPPGSTILYWRIVDQDFNELQLGLVDIGPSTEWHFTSLDIDPVDIDSYEMLRIQISAEVGNIINFTWTGPAEQRVRQLQSEIISGGTDRGYIVYLDGVAWAWNYWIGVGSYATLEGAGWSNFLSIEAFHGPKASNPVPNNAQTDVSPFTENIMWTTAADMVDQRIMFDNGSGSFEDVGHTSESSIAVEECVHWPLWRDSTFRWRVDTKASESGDFEEGDVWTFTTKDFENPSTPFPAADAEDVVSRIGWLGVTIPTDAEEIEFWKDSSVFASPLDKLGSVEITDEMREAGETVMLAFLRDSWDLSSYVTWPINGYETNWHVKVKYPQRLSTYIQETDFTFYTEPLYTPASFEGATPNEEYEDEESGQTFIPGNGSCAVPLKTIMVIAKENKLFYME